MSAKYITQPDDWWAAFEEQAKREEVSLSEWIGDVCWANVPVKVAKHLSERRGRGNPDFGPGYVPPIRPKKKKKLPQKPL